MKRYDWIIIFVIVAIIASTIFAIRVFNLRQDYKDKGKETYNGFDFYFIDNLWVTRVTRDNTEYTIPVRYAPSQVVNVSVDGKLSQFQLMEGYMAFDPNDDNYSYIALGFTELGNNLNKVFNAKWRPACMAEHEHCEGIPIVTCDSTNESVIIIRSSEESKITYVDDHCVILEGNELGILRSFDKFLFMLYGIIK